MLNLFERLFNPVELEFVISNKTTQGNNIKTKQHNRLFLDEEQT